MCASVESVPGGTTLILVVTWECEGIRYAALAQVVADLLTSPGRGPSEGEALIDWMKANENAWRT